MSNCYMAGSCLLRVPVGDLQRAREILVAAEGIDEEGDRYGSTNIEILTDERESGVWFYELESFDPEEVARLAQAAIDGLAIEHPFVFSWAYGYDRPRIDDFGGGACMVQHNQPSVWLDTHHDVMEWAGLQTKR